MSKIKKMLDVNNIPLTELHEELFDFEERTGLDVDFFLIEELEVTTIYKYKNHPLYQIDDHTIILDDKEYYHTDIVKIALYFGLSEDFKVVAYQWQWENVNLKLFNPHYS